MRDLEWEEPPSPMPSPRRSMARVPVFIGIACLVPALLDGWQSYMQWRLDGSSGPVPWDNIVVAGAEWLFLGALSPITYFLAQRFPLRRDAWGISAVAHVGGALLLCVGWAGAGVAMQAVLGLPGPQGQIRAHFLGWALTTLPWSVFMYFAVLGTVYAFTYAVEVRDQEAQAARLAARLAEARLAALRMQLNPHFLFNSLNAIGVLVRDQETRGASRMIELLGDVLRTVLRSDRRQIVTVDEELGFLDHYLAIERVRFSDRLTVEWDVDEGTRRALVPTLILQPLVENALEHGIARNIHGGRIAIGVARDGDTLVLTVADDGAGATDADAVHDPPEAGDDDAGAGRGVGLANVRDRLHTLYGADGTVELIAAVPHGTIARIRLPFSERADA